MVVREPRTAETPAEEGRTDAAEVGGAALAVAIETAAVGVPRRGRRARARRLLEVLGAARPSAEVAAALVRALDDGAFARLPGCREKAVEVLLACGYPHALHVSPEDLAFYRERSRPAALRWAPPVAAAAIAAGAGTQLATHSTAGAAASGVIALALTVVWWLRRR